MISLGFVRKLVVAASLIAAPVASFAGVFISVGIAPPPLPVYAQPVCPADGYLWNPGYWAYGPGGYYWVPGVWVQPPSVGLLWTPPYWGFERGVYGFHDGYWGPHVGFYGGVNYGFGYGGVGFVGGRWDAGRFAYNTAVFNVGGGIRNTYVDREVVVHNTIINNNHVSFNGGPGGIGVHASAQEQAFAHENHVGPTAMQQTHFQGAAQNRANFASANGGHPAMAAYQRPGSTAGAVPARGAAAVGGGANRGGFGAGGAGRPEGLMGGQGQGRVGGENAGARTQGYGQSQGGRPDGGPVNGRPAQQAGRPEQQQTARPQGQQGRPAAAARPEGGRGGERPKQ